MLISLKNELLPLIMLSLPFCNNTKIQLRNGGHLASIIEYLKKISSSDVAQMVRQSCIGQGFVHEVRCMPPKSSRCFKQTIAPSIHTHQAKVKLHLLNVVYIGMLNPD